MKRWVLAGLAAALLAGSGPARGQDDTKATSGAAQLKSAYAVRKRSFGKKGEERRKILLEAVDAYRTVKTSFPDDRKSCATAMLRVGAIYRTLKERDLALKSFQEVLTYAEQRACVARALLEMGHIHRREKDLDAAMDLYGQVPRQCPGERSQGARALVWIAKCHRLKKAYPEARSVLRDVIGEYDSEHTTVLAAYGLLATIHVEEGNPARAREVLEECRDHFRALAQGGDGPDLTGRVEKLRAWKLLAGAQGEAGE